MHACPESCRGYKRHFINIFFPYQNTTHPLKKQPWKPFPVWFSRYAAYYNRIQFKRRRFYELSCQQVHRVYCPAVRLPLRKRELLLSGPDPGGHPRDEPHREPVHRL